MREGMGIPTALRTGKFQPLCTDTTSASLLRTTSPTTRYVESKWSVVAAVGELSVW